MSEVSDEQNDKWEAGELADMRDDDATRELAMLRAELSRLRVVVEAARAVQAIEKGSGVGMGVDDWPDALDRLYAALDALGEKPS